MPPTKEKRPRGRPAVESPRNKLLKVRVTAEELARLDRAAAAVGMDRSKYVRWLAGLETSK